MRRLLKKLTNFYLKEGLEINLTRWQRDTICDFIIEYLKEVKKYNG